MIGTLIGHRIVVMRLKATVKFSPRPYKFLSSIFCIK